VAKKKAASSTYDVGYGKPPSHTRFKAGTSGNPRGRPKGTKNLATLVKNVFSRKVEVQDQGRRRRLTAAEVMLTRIMTKAISGDAASQRISIALLQMQQSDTAALPTLFESDDDRALLRQALDDLNGDSSKKKRRKGGV